MKPMSSRSAIRRHQSISSALFLVLALAVLVGCDTSLQDAGEGDVGTTTFVEDDVTGDSDVSSSSGGDVDASTDSDSDTSEESAPIANACGGAGTLSFRGEAGDLLSPCDCGGVMVCNGPESLRCVDDQAVNICGGCGILSGEIGTPCGLCGGTWVCGPDGDVMCVSDRRPNGCGGCSALAGAPGRECEGEVGVESAWVCSGENSVSCRALAEFDNACGGEGVLEFSGEAVLPGEDCEDPERLCGPGVLVCTEDGSGVTCEGQGLNAAGGCGPLVGVPGEACGCDGTWEVDGSAQGGVRCGDDRRNVCGGCAPLDEAPGAACGAQSVVMCSGLDDTVCVSWVGERNACGGDAELEALPGSECGTCDRGTWVCAGANQVTCDGDPGEAALNPCDGSCDSLTGGVQGGPCGLCAAGTLVCSDGPELVCDEADEEEVLNACGGCASLEADPGTICGECQAWTCRGDGESLECLEDESLPRCAPDAMAECDGYSPSQDDTETRTVAEIQELLGTECTHPTNPSIGECENRWACDIDGVFCDAVVVPDLSGPRMELIDQSCDGMIDGVASQGVFVRAGASGDGTRGDPTGDLMEAIDLAGADSLQVYVAQGEYDLGDNVVTLSDQLSIYGGYDEDFTTRSLSPEDTTINFGSGGTSDDGWRIAFIARDITEETHLQNLTIEVAQPAQPGAGVVGIDCSNCSELVVSHVSLTLAGGADGSDGTGYGGQIAQSGISGDPGTSGGANAPGGSGGAQRSCNDLSSGGGGRGATATDHALPGMWGISGTSAARLSFHPSGAGGGAGGMGHSTQAESGANGGGGVRGGTAQGGSGASLDEDGLPRASHGAEGERGSGGGGGGGGGSIALFINASAGGGGGGGGGCGGLGGGSGQAGGSSFGMVVRATPDGPRVEHTAISPGHGGHGGNGGDGMDGGRGGDRGNRATTAHGGQSGFGGRGGGGAGGGGGGGGSGGWAFALLLEPGSQIRDTGGDTNAFNPGTAGTGGEGGAHGTGANGGNSSTSNRGAHGLPGTSGDPGSAGAMSDPDVDWP